MELQYQLELVDTHLKQAARLAVLEDNLEQHKEALDFLYSQIDMLRRRASNHP